MAEPPPSLETVVLTGVIVSEFSQYFANPWSLRVATEPTPVDIDHDLDPADNEPRPNEDVRSMFSP